MALGTAPPEGVQVPCVIGASAAVEYQSATGEWRLRGAHIQSSSVSKGPIVKLKDPYQSPLQTSQTLTSGSPKGDLDPSGGTLDG